MKINQKLFLGVMLQLVFMLVLVFFIFNISYKLTDVSEQTSAEFSKIEIVKNLATLSKDFINNKVDFDEIEKSFKIVETQKHKEKIMININEIKNKLYKINSIKTSNVEIEQALMELTDNSITQSNTYIYSMSEKLADINQRRNVSTLERLVIGGANNNTNNNYALKILFLQLKENPNLKADITNSLNKTIQQAKNDIEKLKNTPFAQLPVMAHNASTKSLDLVNQYISNVESTQKLSLDLYNISDELYRELNKHTLESMDDSFNNIKNSVRTVFIILLLASLAIIILNSLTSKLISNTFNQLKIDLQKISDGELGFIALQSFINKSDETGILAASINKMINNLKDIISNIRLSADNISRFSNTIKESSVSISTGVNEQAASAEEVSSSMEEMAANIQQNKENAIITHKTSRKTSTSIEEVANSSEESMKAVQDIFSKINVVVEIAEKTDLLAINAAVEAARAGDSGKGFAVVASEVRKLAERSQSAASIIVELAERGMNKTKDSTQKLRELVPEIRKTAELIEEIATASREQDTGASQINDAIQQLSSITQQNAVAAENLADNSSELAEQGVQLEKITQYFNVK